MEKTVAVRAFAKINLSIDILGKMDSGYHRIETIMQQINLSDQITIRSRGRAGLYVGYKIELETDDESLPKSEENLAYKSAKLMAETFCPLKDNNIIISISKRIPMAAGLAGGSSDAAAVMLGLCKLWDITIPLDELCKIGVKIGADVPFCIIGNAKNNPDLGFSEDENASSAALAEGIGEILTPVSPLEGWVVLAKPDIQVSTAFIYEQLSVHGVLPEQGAQIDRPDTKKLLLALEEKNTEQIIKSMVNVLETVSLKEYPIVVYTKNKIRENSSPSHILMSGSGPTVFSYYTNENDAENGFSQIINILPDGSGYKFDIRLAELL